MPRKGSPYGEAAYLAFKARLVDRPERCHLCGGPGATTPDHVPSLYEHRHIPGAGCCAFRPAHPRCNTRRGGWRAATKVREAKRRRRG